jgi:hypothetical protein
MNAMTAATTATAYERQRRYVLQCVDCAPSLGPRQRNAVAALRPLMRVTPRHADVLRMPTPPALGAVDREHDEALDDRPLAV